MSALIGKPLGWIMYACYVVFKNYGIALLLFTFITKLIMFPLSVKQQKSSAKMAKFSPKMQQLQKKYANNKEKLNEEMMKLYSEENYNPMGSCLPLVVTFVLLFGLIDVVYKPLTHIVHTDDATISAISEFIEYEDNDFIFGEQTDNKSYNSRKELYILQAIKANPEYFENDNTAIYQASFFEGRDAVTQDVLTSYLTANGLNEYLSDGDDRFALLADASNNGVFSGEEFTEYLGTYYDTQEAVGDIVVKNAYATKDAFTASFTEMSDDFVAYKVKVSEFFKNNLDDECRNVLDFNNTFLGFDMGVLPTWNSIYVLIPLFSFVSNLFMVIYTQKMSKKQNPSMQQVGGMNAMLYITPVMSLFIAFSVPAGVGLYWTFSSVFSIIQSTILYKFYTPERVAELVEQENKKKKAKKKPSMYERALEAQRVTNGTPAPKPSVEEDTEEVKLSKAEQKEFERRKLNEARKRMAEKYGDDYEE